MDRAAVPEDEVSRLARHQPRPPQRRVDGRLRHDDIVRVVHRGVRQQLAVRSVRARDDAQPARARRRVVERDEPLHRVPARPSPALVDVPPASVGALRAAVVAAAVRPEDVAAVEGADEVVRAPDLREDSFHERQRAEEPAEARLAEAVAPDDAVRGVTDGDEAPVGPRLRLVAPHAGRRGQKIPKKLLGRFDFVRSRHAGDDGVPVLVEVRENRGRGGRCKAWRCRGAIELAVGRAGRNPLPLPPLACSDTAPDVRRSPIAC